MNKKMLMISIAAIVIAMMVLPHFALAATLTPGSATCTDSQGTCAYNQGTDPMVIGNMIDGDYDTGNHIVGPNYPIEFKLDLGSTYTVTAVKIYQSNGATDNHINQWSADPARDNTIDYSTNDSDYSQFGNIPSYGGDDVTVSTGGVSARHLKVINNGNNNGNAGWYPTEFEITTAVASTPEMGVWALLVILPVMFYLAYQSAKTTQIRPLAS